jgi:hypothetical protein
MTPDPAVRLGRKPSAHVVQQKSGVKAYPEPHPVPLLPPGWAPLEPSDEAAVLEACDQFCEACRLRLGSLWDAKSEYRVYCLEGEMWGGVYAATLFACDRNGRLLAITDTPEDAANVALDFLNWDLEALGLNWRLTLANVRFAS